MLLFEGMTAPLTRDQLLTEPEKVAYLVMLKDSDTFCVRWPNGEEHQYHIDQMELSVNLLQANGDTALRIINEPLERGSLVPMPVVKTTLESVPSMFMSKENYPTIVDADVILSLKGYDGDVPITIEIIVMNDQQTFEILIEPSHGKVHKLVQLRGAQRHYAMLCVAWWALWRWGACMFLGGLI